MNILRKSYLNHSPELSRQTAAEKIGVSRQTVHRWEHWLNFDERGYAPMPHHQILLKKLFDIEEEVWIR